MNKKLDFPPNVLPVDEAVLERVKRLDSNALYWLGGYCSGLADAKQGNIPAEQMNNATIGAGGAKPAAGTTLKTVVLYASQTGNSQGVAEALHQKLQQKGLDAELSSLADFKPNKLKDNRVIIMVASTHGEGEPPDDAMEFHDFIRGKRAPKLNGVKHAVLGLGDSSYEYFCQTGKDFDEALTSLGSIALVDRVDCDVDYEEDAQNWCDQVVEALAALNRSDVGPAAVLRAAETTSKAKPRYDKNNPLTAVILSNQRITGRGSVKHINHLEISLSGSDVGYQPGDSLGVWAKNNGAVVRELLELTQLTGDERVLFKNNEKSIAQALSENLELSLINRDFVAQYAKITHSEAVNAVAEKNYQDFISAHQIVDVIKLAPVGLEAQQLVDLLKPIKPRMYSIASSLKVNPDEVHITVGLVESKNDDAIRYGTASHYLLENLDEGDEVLVFVEENRHFRLPDNHRAPIIMIGPGTGIAPFRAFLQEREEEGAEGENWLFFGNPNFNTDFLYQTELQKLLSEGLLTHLTLAFSRDQQEKIYVQDRLLENAQSLWRWLSEKQASLYVCGDMSKMAKDVHAALVTIVSEQGDKSPADAELFLKALKKDNRYQRDVY